MKKKIISVIIALVLICSISIPVAAKGPGLYGDNIEWNYNSETKTLSILGSDRMENYSGVEFRPWNDIADEVEHVIIGNEVTYISDRAFYQMENLVDVNIPDSVTEIGIYAFYQCSNLSSEVEFTNVTKIGEHAFDGTQISFSDFGSLADVGASAFAYDTGITELYIPDGITFAGATFRGCTNLESVSINSNICVSMFEDCTTLESASIGSDVTTVSDYAFYNCSNLSEITFAEGTSAIGQRAFAGCGEDSVELPSTITSIGYAAFCGEQFPELIVCNGNAPAIDSDAITDLAWFAYYSGSTGWDAYDNAMEIIDSNSTVNNVDLSDGNVYAFQFGNRYAYAAGKEMVLSDSNEFTISQSSTDPVSNTINFMNGDYSCILSGINIRKVDNGWGCIRVYGSTSVDFTVDGANTVNNAGNTDDRYYASAIRIEEGSNVSFSGTGLMTLIGSDNKCGIDGGNVTIDCDMYAEGGFCSDGIHAKNLVINGGNITAKGGYFGVGIAVYDTSTCTINGGNIVATSSTYGPGIGVSGTVDCGTIKINGGTVYARANTSNPPDATEADIGFCSGTSGKYLYISKNASVDARYIGNYFIDKASDAWDVIIVEDVSVIKNLITEIEETPVVTTPLATTPTTPAATSVATTPVATQPVVTTPATTPVATPTATTPAAVSAPAGGGGSAAPATSTTASTTPAAANTTTVSGTGYSLNLNTEVSDKLITVSAWQSGTKTIRLMLAKYDSNGKYIGTEVLNVGSGSTSYCLIENTNEIATIKAISMWSNGNYAPILTAPVIYSK